MSIGDQHPAKRRAFTKPDKRGRSGKRARKGNPASGPGDCGIEQWVWLPVEIIGSTTWQALSIKARRILDRVMAKHAHHGGTGNGELCVSHRQFEQAGASRNCVAAAIRECEAAGLLRVQRRGRIAGENEPNLYTLTWMGSWDTNGEIAPRPMTGRAEPPRTSHARMLKPKLHEMPGRRQRSPTKSFESEAEIQHQPPNRRVLQPPELRV